MWVWVWGPMSKRHVACTCIIMCIGGRWMDVGVGLGTSVKETCSMYMCQYA